VSGLHLGSRPLLTAGVEQPVQEGAGAERVGEADDGLGPVEVAGFFVRGGRRAFEEQTDLLPAKVVRFPICVMWQSV
jgi:hypothetical protein